MPQIPHKVFKYSCLITALANAGGNLLLMLFYNPIFTLLHIPIPQELHYFFWMAGLSFTNGVLAYFIYVRPENNLDLLKVGIVGKGLFASITVYFYAFENLHWFFLLFGLWDALFTLIFALFLIQLQSPELQVFNQGHVAKGFGPTSRSAAILTHSMTGTGKRVVERIKSGLLKNNYQVEVIEVEPVEEQLFRFPFQSVLDFLKIAFRAVFRRSADIKPLTIPINQNYDLIIVQGQTWMVGLGAPTEGVFHDNKYRTFFSGKDAAVVIVARGLVRRSQAMLINHLKNCNANVVGSRTYTHIGKEPSRLISLVTYLMFAKTNKPFWLKWFLQPNCGLSDEELLDAENFAKQLAQR